MVSENEIVVVRAHPRDLDFVRTIDRSLKVRVWTREEWVEVLRHTESSLFVAKWNNLVVGYVLAEFEPSICTIRRMGVSQELQRNGVGTHLVDYVKDLAEVRGRRMIEIVVGEKDLGYQLFLRSQGFLADKIIRVDPSLSYDGSENFYRFRYTLRNKDGNHAGKK